MKLSALIKGGVKALEGHADVPQAVMQETVMHTVTMVRQSASNEAPLSDLVRKFMEVDGLSKEDATALAAVSIQPRPVKEWLDMIAELDRAIEMWCNMQRIGDEERAQIMSVRFSQPLVSIPASLAWFNEQIRQNHERTA